MQCLIAPALDPTRTSIFRLLNIQGEMISFRLVDSIGISFEGRPVKMDAKVFKVPVFLISTASFVLIVAGMSAAASLINPFLLAVFLATLCSPPLHWLQHRGVPNGLAVSAIVLGLLIVASLLMVFVGRSLNTLAQQLPMYQARLTDLMARVFAWLDAQGLDISKSPLSDYVTPRTIMSMVSYGLSTMRGLFTNIFLILLTVFFILLEASGFPRKLKAAFPDPERTLGHFKTIMASINRYMGFKALFSLATGVTIWILLTVIGVEFAATWGLLAFLLNFIPNIGSIIAAIPAILWALVQLGLPSALLTLIVYAAVNVVIGNFLEPRFVGHKLGLSTLVVFLSLIFWGWVLGPVGMVLSVPLTMIFKIALATSEETRWIALMLE
jgi:AI-2 transport protein TqsA